MVRFFSRSVVLGAALLAATLTIAAQSTTNDPRPFNRDAFGRATTAGRTVIVAFHAPWCPVCKAQEPKVNALLNSDYRDVLAFNVDYDSNLALRKEMNVLKQATLIMFRGKKEIARLTFQSDDASIREFFSHAKEAAVR